MNKVLAAGIAGMLSLIAAPVSSHQAVDPRILRMVPNVPGDAVPRARRAEDGRRLFFTETFGGNGRTCGTCHREDNNLTIDAPFIRTLPLRDKLFVAETNPALAGLENPALMRQFGLILENLDGFDQPGVMRGVPHTLALDGSRRPEPGTPQSALSEVLGWGGDGSPGNGSLRNFAVGAVVQHFTRTLARRPGIDFDLPSEQQLDSLLAFQLSLGRQSEINLPAMVFADPTVTAGQTLFNGAPARDGSIRACAGCHNNAGATDSDGNNRNRMNDTQFLPTAPACRGDAPGDGGFLFEPVLTVPFCGKVVTFRGDRSFNTPPLVEAADTPPFFHNNAVDTIEQAVEFYTSDTFNNSPTGAGRAFVLTTADVNAIGAMLRTINAVENIRETIELLDGAASQTRKRRQATLKRSIAETGDAIEVLTEGPVAIFAGTDTVAQLIQARDLQRRALRVSRPGPLLDQAQLALRQARARMVL